MTWRARFIFMLCLVLVPLCLSFVNLPGLPAPASGTGMAAVIARRQLELPIYTGSILAWSLLPIVAISLGVLTLLGRKSREDSEIIAMRERHARAFLSGGTALLAVALAVWRTWSLTSYLGSQFPSSPLPIFGLAAQAVLSVGLVVSALAARRWGIGSGIAAVVAGDSIAHDFSAFRNRSDLASDWLHSHAPHVVGVVLGTGLLLLVLREAPGRDPSRLVRIRALLRPLWPLLVASIGKAVVVGLLVAEVVAQGDLDRILDHDQLEAALACALLIGGLAIIVLHGLDHESARQVGLGQFSSAELALLPTLAAGLVGSFIYWRATIAASNAEPYLPTQIAHLIQVVAEYRLLVCALVGVVVLVGEVQFLRWAKRFQPPRDDARSANLGA